MLVLSRSYLRERTGVEITWDRNKIRRLFNYEVIGNADGKQHIVLPNIETEAAAQNLIYNIWLESPNTYPVIFVTSEPKYKPLYPELVVGLESVEGSNGYRALFNRIERPWRDGGHVPGPAHGEDRRSVWGSVGC